jgi:hypothetical protein
MARPPKPQGQRFSHIYLERGEPRQDSRRMRRRLGELVFATPYMNDGLMAAVRREMGLDVPYPARWPDYLETIELVDFLDLITVAYRDLVARNYRTSAAQWLREVQRIFDEQNVHYVLDAVGGVHYAVDREFAFAREAAIAALRLPRYANALDAFERGMDAIGAAQPDGKGAIRGVFASAEGLFRLLAPRAPRLGGAELREHLTPVIERLYTETSRRSSLKMLASLSDWVDAAHFYRHEEGAEEVAQPPLEIAVHIVACGAAHIRWLAELDAQIQPA